MMEYPESKIDYSEVYEQDDFAFSKKDGLVKYHHNFKDPFKKDYSKIIGAYIIIKNRVGEFITILNKEELEKHRKVAKTDYIWKQWYIEMVYKTMFKKGTRIFFENSFEVMYSEDNKQIDLDKPTEIDIELKQKLEEIKTEKELNDYYREIKWDLDDKHPEVLKAFAQRKKEIQESENV